jgi:hypothetical protein
MTSPQPCPTLSWFLSLESPDPGSIVRWLVTQVWKHALPVQLSVDYEDIHPEPDWLEELDTQSLCSLVAYWDTDDSPSLVWNGKRCVTSRFSFPADLPAMQALLKGAPFEVAAFGNFHRAWREPPLDYSPPSFGSGHYPLGWGCAFKGAGHARLVSRRWLTYGPWKLYQEADDLSFIQFHNLNASPVDALKQARPGHRLLGLGDESGFMQMNYVYEQPPAGLYSADEKMLRVLMVGRSPSTLEMLDACAAKRLQALGPDKPLERIAYIFADESAARASLHSLWLRQLECWAVIDGVEHRLDESYEPPSPRTPSWARS